MTSTWTNLPSVGCVFQRCRLVGCFKTFVTQSAFCRHVWKWLPIRHCEVTHWCWVVLHCYCALYVAYCTDGVYLSDLLGFGGTCFAVHGQMLVNWLIDWLLTFCDNEAGERGIVFSKIWLTAGCRIQGIQPSSQNPLDYSYRFHNLTHGIQMLGKAPANVSFVSLTWLRIFMVWSLSPFIHSSFRL